MNGATITEIIADRGTNSNERAMKRPNPPITVLCVDDHPEMVRALRSMIDMERDMVSVDGVHDTGAFMAAALELKPRVAVVDLSLPGRVAPLDAIRRVAEDLPGIRIIVYSGRDDRRAADAVMSAGAWALISKASDPRELLEAIRRAGTDRMAV